MIVEALAVMAGQGFEDEGIGCFGIAAKRSGKAPQALDDHFNLLAHRSILRPFRHRLWGLLCRSSECAPARPYDN
ncbi:hypothetical protein GCM10007874_64640 [Labrys miyagiensis]|uniref:Uncharacterized protein n=1 Tax=Labrys miyagiensis TaxID=346912 RepID=A0ABQ6CT05_9HYPH|nr:hypothetical protein GCM10007874_64640 [Labrys miyagiensis]